jgi:UDP-N-acetylmuramoyl-L-alanyl-D-glutamate--2,6-diaminopimelate ligase
MKLREIAAQSWVERSLVESGEAELERVTCDSRHAGADTAFFALPGRVHDGHRFLDAALAAGAPAVFMSDAAEFARLAEAWEAVRIAPRGRRAALFRVHAGRTALADLVQLVYGRPSEGIELLGVTGTNGKATVTYLAAQMLGAMGTPCGIVGGLGFHLPVRSFPSERTTPEAPDIADFLRLCREDRVRAVAMEVSSIGIHQERTRGLTFRAAAYTNLTQDHLDYHGTMAAYAAEKERLFREYAIGAAVLNLDDPVVAELCGRMRARRGGIPVVTFALEGAADLTVADLRLDAAGSSGTLRQAARRIPFSLVLPGAYNVSNWLAALGLLMTAGHDLEAAVAAAPHCSGAPGRLERVGTPVPFSVLVDYAHTPAALETVLRALRPLTRARLIVAFGCGGDRDPDKRPKMGAIAEKLADVVVLTSDNPRSERPQAILAEIRRGMTGGGRVLQIEDRREAIYAALDAAAPGDLVLLAGKGSEAYQEVQGRKLAFDDRDIVRQWSRERAGA